MWWEPWCSCNVRARARGACRTESCHTRPWCDGAERKCQGQVRKVRCRWRQSLNEDVQGSGGYGSPGSNERGGALSAQASTSTSSSGPAWGRNAARPPTRGCSERRPGEPVARVAAMPRHVTRCEAVDWASDHPSSRHSQPHPDAPDRQMSTPSRSPGRC